MSSATKTLNLLSYFSASQPEIGLSQLCRLAKRDKATTHRHLQTLEETGFVEQNPATRQYRLGPAVLRLAQTREITVPRKSGAEAAVAELAHATGETAHVSVLSGASLYALTSFESPRHSTRVIIDIATFPLHATASGLCALAFGPSDLLATAHSAMKGFTRHTIRTTDALDQAIAQTRDSGFGRGICSLEDEVSSLGAPIYDETGAFAGAVAVACVSTRFTPRLEQQIKHHLITASRQITRNWGGTLPATLEATWAETLSPALEPTP